MKKCIVSTQFELVKTSFKGGYRGLKGTEYLSPRRGISTELGSVIQHWAEGRSMIEDFLQQAIGFDNPAEAVDAWIEGGTLPACQGHKSPKVFQKDLTGRFGPLMLRVIRACSEEREEVVARFLWGAFRLEAEAKSLRDFITFIKGLPEEELQYTSLEAIRVQFKEECARGHELYQQLVHAQIEEVTLKEEAPSIGEVASLESSPANLGEEVVSGGSKPRSRKK